MNDLQAAMAEKKKSLEERLTKKRNRKKESELLVLQDLEDEDLGSRNEAKAKADASDTETKEEEEELSRLDHVRAETMWTLPFLASIVW